MGKLSIERPGETDWPGILAVLKAANLHRIGGAEMREFPLSDCFIARENGGVVGVCGYRIVDATTARNTMTAIAPSHRGSGVATRLKRACLEYLTDQGIATLYTNCDDPAVIDWNVRHFGFRRTGKLIPKEENFGRADKDHWVNLVSERPFCTFSILDEEVCSCQKHGYLQVRGRFTDREAHALIQEVEQLWGLPGLAEHESYRVQGRDRLSGGRALDRLDWVVPLSARLAALAVDRRITEPVAQLLGDQPVLFKDKLIVRPPGTHGYGLHQDFPYWEAAGVPANELLTVCIALDEVGRHNGMLGVYAGYHDRRLASPPGEPLDTDPGAVDETAVQFIPMQAGDLLLFHSLTPHLSGPNRSDQVRRMVYFTYASARHGADVYQRFRDLKYSEHTGSPERKDAGS